MFKKKKNKSYWYAEDITRKFSTTRYSIIVAFFCHASTVMPPAEQQKNRHCLFGDCFMRCLRVELIYCKSLNESIYASRWVEAMENVPNLLPKGLFYLLYKENRKGSCLYNHSYFCRKLIFSAIIYCSVNGY